jgi:hypothetical protein
MRLLYGADPDVSFEKSHVTAWAKSRSFVDGDTSGSPSGITAISIVLADASGSRSAHAAMIIHRDDVKSKLE